MARGLIVLLGVGFVAGGCATMGSSGSSSACVDDLQKYIGTDHRSHLSAENYCSQKTPEQIANAKQLIDEKYEENFGVAMKATYDVNKEQIACAKKEWNALPPEERGRFQVSTACRELVLVSAPAAAQAGSSVFDVLTAAGNAKTFLRMVDVGGLTDTLKGSAAITVFVMTDDAWAKDAKRTEWLMARPDRAREAMTKVIAMGRFPSTDLQPATERYRDKPISVATVGNATRKLTLRDGVIKVDGAKVVKADIPASNGLAHLVDGDLSR